MFKPSHLHKGEEVHLKDDAGTFKKIIRKIDGSLCGTSSHKLNHVGKLIKRHDKNQRAILSAIEKFDYLSVAPASSL